VSLRGCGEKRVSDGLDKEAGDRLDEGTTNKAREGGGKDAAG
jgi:hypothetical protein